MTLKGIFGRASYADEQRRWLYGRLGRLADDGTTYIIEVPYREKYLWVRMGANGDQAPMIAYNKGGVALRGNLPVRMRRDNGVLTIYEVDAALLSIDPNAPATPGGVAIHHHRSVAGTPEAANPLSFELETKQIDRGRVWSAGGMSVTINAFRYYFNGAWQTWEGGDLDLTANIPGDAGEHAWVLVGIDPATNTAVAVTGTSVIYATPLVYADLDAIAFGEYIPCGAVKVRDDDTALTDVTDYVDAHGWHNGGPAKAATAVVYVAKTGADTLDGLHPERPKLTIGAAITAADALITAGADKVRVEVLDGGTYSENLVLGPDMILHAPAATVVGTLQLDDGCSALLDRQYPSASNDQVLISRITTGDGEISSYRANIVDGRGVGGAVTGTINIQNESETGVIFCWVGQVFVAQGGFGIRDSAGAGFGHIHFILNDLYLAGNNAIGLRNTNGNTNLIGYIDHILEIGSPTGTKGVQILASGGVVKLTASEIIADEAYDIAGGTFYLSCPKVTGTLTGTPTSIQSNRLVITDESRPTTLTATAEKTTPVDADKFFEGDSADSGFLKWVSWANIKATLTTLFSGLYLLVAGKAGGQTAYGGTGAGESATIEGTSHATKGPVLLNPSGGNVGIGTATPGIDVVGTFDYGATVKVAEVSGLTSGRLLVKGSGDAGLDLVDTGAGADLKWMQLVTNGGATKFFSLTDAAAVKKDNILWMDHASGGVVMGAGLVDTNVKLNLFNAVFAIFRLSTGSGLSTYRDWVLNVGGNVAGALHIQVSDTASGTPYGSGKSVMTMTSGRLVGIGTEAPQGKLHLHDGTMGGMFVSKTGIVDSAVTIIPNGSGDVLRGIGLYGVAYDGVAAASQIAQTITPGGGAVITTDAGQQITISCAADGSVTVARTAGTRTWTIGLHCVWL